MSADMSGYFYSENWRDIGWSPRKVELNFIGRLILTELNVYQLGNRLTISAALLFLSSLILGPVDDLFTCCDQKETPPLVFLRPGTF